MTNGNMLYMPVPTLDITKELEIKQKQDSETLSTFQTWVTNYNNFIVESYKRKADAVFSSDEQEVLDAFITVDE